ncbi:MULTISPECIES: LysR family transcriptional regulator [unclassified Mycolicibacterium]|uniref:LysR family transcriptional regulator n=1 Tax=unclassified Mycolicibacterium TaxID=2636767 RepID=UPI0012DC0B2F|nr:MULTISPECIES: LysR family transcriptional regulator [unclassified Mycolicibacterium]MUL81195.1 LysR family transcriptional regulator [Mycolicibacterium sp. CBMA 329]MUL86961.1 LysR family transcriptional regulator [Mycolicibacterium sp. CBMA 331]MUL98755.1 LysR family transcriptional regulator [Mycolicibacterium sp. CBMA 334]MUM25615.1 LysR family transcriptional regulator [Mycolicibacterium sp. CBMA 295]MUM37258.1 LysR family transcriptional regulator [Mycolicibacterium sp. CBMA 247]
MELRQLEYFVAVAEEGSFTKAAARMHIAQSGVSAQILLLERELGQRLFDRSRPSVRLTKVGTALLTHARTALAAVSDAKHVANEYSAALRGHVSVGLAASSSLAFNLADMLARFHRDHPMVEISLLEASTEDLVNGLLDGRHDAAIMSPPGTLPPDLQLQLVADEPLVAAVCPDHPLSARATVTLEDLVGCQLITFSPTIGTRSIIDAAFIAAGIEPHVGIEASDPNVLAELACGGLGVALVPEPYARARDLKLHVLQISDMNLRGSLALAWNNARQPTASARRLIDHARQSLQSG